MTADVSYNVWKKYLRASLYTTIAYKMSEKGLN